MWPYRRLPTRLPRPWDSQGKNTGVGCHFLLQCVTVKIESELAQSCRTRSDPMDCRPPGSSIHGIFQARVLEWGAIAFSKSLLSLSKFLVTQIPIQQIIFGTCYRKGSLLVSVKFAHFVAALMIVITKIWTEGLTSFWHIERCAEFIASKGDDTWPFVKNDRNSNITVPTNKGRLASRLTFSSVRTVLPSLV